MSDHHRHMSSGLTPRQRHYDASADSSSLRHHSTFQTQGPSQNHEVSHQHNRQQHDGTRTTGGTSDYFNISDIEQQQQQQQLQQQQQQQQESHVRSILKGITWRIVASMTTITIAFLVTGEIALAFQIGVVEFIAKIGIYYVHERFWLQIPI